MPLSLTPEFERAIQRDPWRCILFVGAGLSTSGVRERGKGLPDWHTLMRHMIEYLRDSKKCDGLTLKRLQGLLDEGDYLEVARVFKGYTRPDQFLVFLRAELDPPDITSSKIHEVILKTRFKGILTTNFDTVFEHQSKRLQPLVYPQCLDDIGSFREDGFFAKIHGCIRNTTNPYENLILTKESYRALRSNLKYHAILRSLFIQYPMLTVGFSLRDPDFVGILSDLKEILGEAMPTVYALMARPEENARREWRGQGVEIIPYETHGELLRFFKEMSRLSEQKHPSPRLTNPPLFPTKVKEVKPDAWRFYSEWRRQGSISPKFGRVEITLKAWRHITRISRPQREICHKLSLLPCARQIVETCTESVFLRRINTRELHALRGLYQSRFARDVVVEVILEITKEGENVRGAKLLAVHEKRDLVI